MKIDILDFDREIKQNNIQQVTNSIYFNNGNNPTDDGLFSYKIFGRPGSKEREENYAYIDLRRKFIHPSSYDLLKKLDRKIEDVVLCRKFFTINNYGELVEDAEKGETGIDFLYKNFNKLSFRSTGTKSRDKKLSLVTQLKITEVFIDKWLVAPCYIRDFNPNGGMNERSSVDNINKVYSRLIMLTNSIRPSDSEYSFTGFNTQSNIQLILNELYEYFINKISGKSGYIHQALLGKTVDRSTRSVISAPRFTSETFEGQEVMFGYTGVPITQLIVLFYPFYIRYIQDFMIQHEMDIRLIKRNSDNTESSVNKEVLSVKEVFTEELIKKILELFVQAEAYRFQKLFIESSDGSIYKLEMFKKELGRDFTLMDLLFLATNEIIQNKHVYVTRYPIETFQNIYPSKISILSTRKTVAQSVNNTYFPNYPYIIPDYPCKSSDLIMTVVMNNSYLGELGADYDGDTVSLRGVYSVEANAEAERLIYAKTNLLDQSGTLSRSIGNEAVQAIYTLTMD